VRQQAWQKLSVVHGRGGVRELSLSLHDHSTVSVRCDIPNGSRVVSRLVKIIFLVNQ